MKKQFFTFLMMIALVIVAGSAMAANENQVYRKGVYTYNLTDITVVGVDASVTIDYEGDASETVTINSGFSGTTSPYVAPVGNNYAGNFSIEFSASATVGTANLVVTITDGAASGCFNYINFQIEVLADPTIDLAMVASEDQYCQQLNPAPGNNAAASVGGTNSITFTVTPTINNTGANAYTYDYVVNLPIDGETVLGSYLISYSGPGTFTEISGVSTVLGANNTNPGVFTITFNTTTGIAIQTITGTVSAADITITNGGAEFAETATANNEDIVTVKRTPSIGSFN